MEDAATGESEKILWDIGERVLVHMQFFHYRINIPKPAENIKTQAGDGRVELY